MINDHGFDHGLEHGRAQGGILFWSRMTQTKGRLGAGRVAKD